MPRRTDYSKADFHFVDLHVSARLRRRRGQLRLCDRTRCLTITRIESGQITQLNLQPKRQ
jgi:hypothetical protein